MTPYSISFQFLNISFIFFDRFSQGTQVGLNLVFSMPQSPKGEDCSQLLDLISLSHSSFYFTSDESILHLIILPF